MTAKKATPKPRITKAHREDIAKLSKQLAEAAERHGLCSTFQDEIETINEGLLVPLVLPTPTVSGWVRVEVRLEVTDVPSNGGRWADELDDEFADTLVTALNSAIKAAKLPDGVQVDSHSEITDYSLYADN